MTALAPAVLGWYDHHERPLPWRGPGASPWRVMVSEFMLQQTPVARVLPVFGAWVVRWPTPASLATASTADVIRAWGRLGYPRRALRLHRAAGVIVSRHGGEVPASLDALRALPGVGEYTAAAVASFAFGGRHTVLDVNVRRVLARSVRGVAAPPAGVTAAERTLAESLLPEAAASATRYAAAVMELGALVCTARRPLCDACPLAATCAWRAAGSPVAAAPASRRRAYEGTDRQARGRLLAMLREAPGPVTRRAFDVAWPDAVQCERALAGLVADGLAEPAGAGRFRLPQ